MGTTIRVVNLHARDCRASRGSLSRLGLGGGSASPPVGGPGGSDCTDSLGLRLLKQVKHTASETMELRFPVVLCSCRVACSLEGRRASCSSVCLSDADCLCEKCFVPSASMNSSAFPNRDAQSCARCTRRIRPSRSRSVAHTSTCTAPTIGSATCSRSTAASLGQTALSLRRVARQRSWSPRAAAHPGPAARGGGDNTGRPGRRPRAAPCAVRY